MIIIPVLMSLGAENRRFYLWDNIRILLPSHVFFVFFCIRNLYVFDHRSLMLCQLCICLKHQFMWSYLSFWCILQKHHWTVRFHSGLPGVSVEVFAEKQGPRSELVLYFFSLPIMECLVQIWMKKQDVNQRIVSEIKKR